MFLDNQITLIKKLRVSYRNPRMSVLRQIQPLQWSALPNIDDIAPISEEDEYCLQDIKDVLEKHGCLSRFGIALLHTHFPIQEDEVMVESCDPQKRTLISQPVKCDLLTEKNSIETLWRFDAEGSNLSCFNKCFTTNDGRHVSRHEAYPPDSNFVSESILQ